jgi:hypothetical protein
MNESVIEDGKMRRQSDVSRFLPTARSAPEAAEQVLSCAFGVLLELAR